MWISDKQRHDMSHVLDKQQCLPFISGVVFKIIYYTLYIYNYIYIYCVFSVWGISLCTYIYG